MTVGQALAAAARRLAEAGIESDRLDARLLLASVLGIEASANPDRSLSPRDLAVFDRLVDRRSAREPVSRVLGMREFWSLDFRLTDDTLDPRPDSETLVEAALAQFPPRPPRRVLDFGTGTGCLLLAVLSERPEWSGVGIDIAAGAVTAARVNADVLGLSSRARFETGDWDAGLTETFDLILSNPPYIPTADIDDLDPEVRRFDPRRALDGGSDGLAAYRALAPAILRRLAPDGRALLELGQGQGDSVAAIMAEARLVELERRKDLAGIERCLVIGRFRAP